MIQNDLKRFKMQFKILKKKMKDFLKNEMFKQVLDIQNHFFF